MPKRTVSHRRRGVNLLFAAVALFLGAPAGAGEPKPDLDLRLTGHAMSVGESDAAGLTAAQREGTGANVVGAGLRVRAGSGDWRAEVDVRERQDLTRSGSSRHQIPKAFIQGERVLGPVDLALGRFQIQEGLGFHIVDGGAVGGRLGEFVRLKAFGGLRPRSWDTEDFTTESFTTGVVGELRAGSLDATVTASMGQRETAAGPRARDGEDLHTWDHRSVAASAAWRHGRWLTLTGGAQVADRLEVTIRGDDAAPLRYRVQPERLSLGLSTVHLAARIRPTKRVRVVLSTQRIQSETFTGPEEEDAFQDAVARVHWRFWRTAAVTGRYRKRLRQEGEDDDRYSGRLSLDDALVAGLLLNGGAHHTVGDGHNKTFADAELGWATSLGKPGRLVEVAATASWVRRDNSDGGDSGYSAALLGDSDDPTSTYPYALAPNDTFGGRLTYMEGTVFAFLEANRDRVSEQSTSFLVAGYHFR